MTTTFFGHASGELKKQWSKDLADMQELMKAFNINKNLIILPNAKEAPIASVNRLQRESYWRYWGAIKKVERDAEFLDKKQVKKLLTEKEVSYKDEKETLYLESNVKEWYTTQKRVGDDFMTHIMIYEFSHAAIYTEDFVYGANFPEVNPLPLYGLPVVKVAEKYQLVTYKSRGGNFGNASDFQKLAYENQTLLLLPPRFQSIKHLKTASKENNFNALLSIDRHQQINISVIFNNGLFSLEPQCKKHD